jgi:hypothetical protein
VALVLMNGYIPLVSSITQKEILQINTYLLLIDCMSLPFFGWISSKIKREYGMIVSSLAVLLFAFPLTQSLENGSLSQVILVRTLFVLFGVSFFAPFHAWAQELVPRNVRYLVISLGYALGTQLLGSPTASFSLWCFQKTHHPLSLCGYWMFLAWASIFSIFISLRYKERLRHMINSGDG